MSGGESANISLRSQPLGWTLRDESVEVQVLARKELPCLTVVETVSRFWVELGADRLVSYNT